MKGKALTYVLMACVAAVWGIIFYRIYLSVAEDEPTIATAPTTKVAYFKMVNHANDTVKLDLAYRNPFEEKNFVNIEEKADRSGPVTKIAAPQMLKPQVNWSGIIYSGYISNPSSKQKLAILSVNGKETLLVEGQSANGLKLLKYLGDSIKVQYQGETKHIRIK
ncbi:hypothetical protein [Pedobacter sp. ASV28]|uniref:hypothetical protein n=1 Tax=Pedobacter sp. ASV28 TaxID=2795123 RepID=UPI0018EBE2DD|nr:hypothetical protein [Pedobacter sp. ASV28]